MLIQYKLFFILFFPVSSLSSSVDVFIIYIHVFSIFFTVDDRCDPPEDNERIAAECWFDSNSGLFCNWRQDENNMFVAKSSEKGGQELGVIKEKIVKNDWNKKR